MTDIRGISETVDFFFMGEISVLNNTWICEIPGSFVICCFRK